MLTITDAHLVHVRIVDNCDEKAGQSSEERYIGLRELADKSVDGSNLELITVIGIWRSEKSARCLR